MENESIQDIEIAELKSTFDGQVNDIKGVGDFTHVLSLRPARTDVQCKFQLIASYPDDPPQVSVRSSVLSPEEATSFTQFLQAAAQSFVGAPMIKEVMQKGMEWLQDNNINIDSDTLVEKTVKKKGKSKKKSKSNKQKSEEPPTKEDDSTKKPPMKTASDVIKRLQWDPDVDKEDFIVGYMDRLMGLQERPFTAFTWEDLATVDQFALAIPQHRIQYFKYKTVKVWDKNERLDNVFGSTGSGCTITGTIARYEATLRRDEDHGSGFAEKADENNMEPDGTVECYDERYEEIENKVDYEDSEKSEGACGIERHIQHGNSENTDLKKFENNTEDEACRITIKKGKKSNYFIGLRIQDENTLRSLADVQRQIIEMYPIYRDYMINKNGFHLTLQLISLRTSEEIRNCVSAMKSISQMVREYMKRVEPLVLKGLDHFGPNLIYGKVKHSRGFIFLVERITEKLKEAEVNVVSENHNLHITLFKVPKSVKRNIRSEPPILLRFNDLDIGTQPVDNLHLCQMGTLTETSDFYTTAASIVL